MEKKFAIITINEESQTVNTWEIAGIVTAENAINALKKWYTYGPSWTKKYTYEAVEKEHANF